MALGHRLDADGAAEWWGAVGEAADMARELFLDTSFAGLPDDEDGYPIALLVLSDFVRGHEPNLSAGVPSEIADTIELWLVTADLAEFPDDLIVTRKLKAMKGGLGRND